MSFRFDHQLSASSASDERRAEILANPGFGKFFTDHMISVTWTPDGGWHDGVLRAYGPLQLDPATAVLHYAQEIFEGLKVYRHGDGSIVTFRPDANAARFQRSARRMALPDLPVEVFLASLRELVGVDRDWVPSGEGQSLYLRPFMYASEVFLGVRPAHQVTYVVIASPAASYFAGGVKPVSIWLSEEYTRAAFGGTGAAKCGGNYAASLLPQQEAIDNGCDQVVFIDALERRWIEELGGMNLFFVYDDGTIVTPELTGTILEGITRDSIITLANDRGYKVDERRIDLDEWRSGVASGRITEVFACGTAAVVTPVGSLKWRGGELVMTESEAGPVTSQLRETLLGIQYGTAEDRHGWMRRLA